MSDPTLLKDIKAGAGDGSPSELVAIGSILYFRAGTNASGNELWKSDGTANGTIQVKDIALWRRIKGIHNE